MPEVDNAYAEDDGGSLSITKTMWLWSIFAEGLSVCPDSAALVSLYQPRDHLADLVGPFNRSVSDSDHLVWSYRQLEIGATKLAAHLSLKNGVSKGCIIISFVWNSAEYALILLAAAKLQATYAPLDPRLLDPGREEELEYYLTQLCPSVVVANTIDEATIARFTDKSLSHKLLARIVCNTKDTVESVVENPDWTSLARIAKDFQGHNDPAQIRIREEDGKSEDATLILFTSGTTSKPKGCIRTAGNLASQSALHKVARRLTASSKVLITTPCFRAICNSWVTCTWRSGAAIVFPSISSQTRTSMEAIQSQRCTHATMVPIQLRMMFQDPSFDSYDLSSFRYIELVGDVITREFLARAQQLSPDAFVCSMFGMTEASAVVSWKTDDTVPFTKSGLASVGHASPGCRVKVCKPGTRDLARREEMGDLYIGGPTILSGYIGGRHAEDFHTDELGRRWFSTEDQAVMDQSGFVYVLGRFKDLIVRGGLKLSPVVIEKCLEKDENIQAAQVVGVPDDHFGEVPVAVIKAAHGAAISKPEATQRVMRELGPESELRAIYMLSELSLEDFPLNPTGKVMKASIKSEILRLRSH